MKRVPVNDGQTLACAAMNAECAGTIESAKSPSVTRGGTDRTAASRPYG